MRLPLVFALLVVATGGGAFGTWRYLHGPATVGPSAATVVERLRETSRLEALDVQLYKKITFAPDPNEDQGFWTSLYSWARQLVRPPEGRAIIFADAHFGVDLSKLDQNSIEAHGKTVWIVLPKLDIQIELKPSETEIIGSNLDSSETAAMFEQAKQAFARDVAADVKLMKHAEESTEHAVELLLLRSGLHEVHFVSSLPGIGFSG